MSRKTTIVWTCLVLMIAAVEYPVCNAGTQKECEAVHRELELHREKLTQYLAAERDAYTSGDLRLMALFNRQIGILVDKIIEIEESVDCPEPAFAPSDEGLSPTRTLENRFLEKSCGELKRVHLQLLIKINSLKRREHSTFSQLSTEERNELDKAIDDVRGVWNAWKAKCSRKRKRGGSKARRHTPLRAPRSPLPR